MATKYQCIQGDSFSMDFSCDTMPTFDVQWTGSWAIVDSLDDKSDGDNISTLASGTMSISGDSSKIELRILPTDTESIPVGFYILVAQITNSSINFNNEVIQNSFEITKQGI